MVRLQVTLWICSFPMNNKHNLNLSGGVLFLFLHLISLAKMNQAFSVHELHLWKMSKSLWYPLLCSLKLLLLYSLKIPFTNTAWSFCVNFMVSSFFNKIYIYYCLSFLLFLLTGIQYYLKFIKDYTEHFVHSGLWPSLIFRLHRAPPPCLYPPSRARIHARRSLGNTRTNMAASVSPLRSSFRICSPLAFPRHCCRAKLRMHRKCESQRRHVHQTATR